MKLHIPLETWQQMRGYCLASSPNEITGVGTIMLYHDHFLVDQVFIPRQKVCPGYCESDNGAINEIIFNVVEDNPAYAGLSSMLLKIILHMQANSGSAGTLTPKAAYSGQAPTKKILTLGKVHGQST